MTEEVEQLIDEESLFFKRFPAEKQDQVRALVNYATLMGLNGKDLVSIGGKLDRIKAKREKDRMRTIAEEVVKSCALIGNDRKSPRRDPTRWTYTDGTGRKWKFDNAQYWSVRVTSDTGVTKTFRDPERYDIGRGTDWWTLKQIMLNVHEGEIQLNF
jgi:hypothetical protein